MILEIFNIMNEKEIITESAKYFSSKVTQFGDSPQGVDWNSTEAQEIRLKQVMKVLEFETNFSLNDLGCGSGKLIEMLHTSFPSVFKYVGSDISKEMIDLAISKYSTNEYVNFIHLDDINDLTVCDFTLASGIFNMKQNISKIDWETYIINTLKIMNLKSHRGFSFNMLTSYSDKEKMRSDLYYGDPCFFFDFCKKNFSKNVSLLHDYGLYDFTIIVRKELL